MGRGAMFGGWYRQATRKHYDAELAKLQGAIATCPFRAPVRPLEGLAPWVSLSFFFIASHIADRRSWAAFRGFVPSTPVVLREHADVPRTGRPARAVGAPPEWIIVAAEPITDADTTAADMLHELDVALNERGISLVFAEMKDPVRCRAKQLAHVG